MSAQSEHAEQVRRDNATRAQEQREQANRDAQRRIGEAITSTGNGGW